MLKQGKNVKARKETKIPKTEQGQQKQNNKTFDK